MPIHKLIRGGEQYLPFALSKLRDLAESGGGARKFIVDDGATILLSVVGEQQFITILGGGGYEFFMPEPIIVNKRYFVLDGLIATDDPATTGGFAIVAGSGAVYVPGRESKPVFSEVLTPESGGIQWKVRPKSALFQTTTPPAGVVRAPNFFKTWPSWQNQKGAEFSHYPGGKGDKLVTSTRGFGPGLSSTAGWWGYILYDGFAFSDFQLDPPLPATGTVYRTAALNRVTDVGKDIPAAYYSLGGVQAGAPELEDHIDWRRASVYKATGGRKFFVMHDTHGKFHVYPVKNYFTAAHPSVRTSEFKSYTPPYPDWVTVPNDEISRSATQREYVFSFNKDCTKVVGTPFKEETGEVWTVKPTTPPLPFPATAKDDFGVDPYLSRFYYETPPISSELPRIRVLTDIEDPEDFQPPQFDVRYWHTPGLVEFDIEITVSGDGDMDFDATFTLAQSSFYNDDFRYYVDAGYLMRNRRMKDDAEAILKAKEDDLLTAEIELYWQPPVPQPGEDPQLRIGRNPGGDTEIEPGILVERTSYELCPFLPGSPSIQQATARCSQFGAQQQAMAFYTVRKHETQEVVRRFMLCPAFGDLPGTINNFSSVSNTLTAADIRSLSFVINSHHEGGEATASVFAWNERQESVTNFAGTIEDAIADTGMDDEPPDSPYIALPADDMENSDVAMYFMQMASVYFMQLSWFSPITAHPHGHWSCGLSANLDVEGKLDIIQAYKPGGEAYDRTSHLAEYNKAFGQERLPTFHGSGDPADLDIAPMATTGIWRMS